MVVLPYHALCTLGRLPRSDEATTHELLQLLAPTTLVGVFVSQDWWVHDEPGCSSPDYPDGHELAHLKYAVLLRGLAALIERHGLVADRIVVWMDWWSVDQDDPTAAPVAVGTPVVGTYVGVDVKP